jgi:hypothetical protein
MRDQEEKGHPEQAVECFASLVCALHRCLDVCTTLLGLGAQHFPSPLARQRVGSAPRMLLRCSPCLPRTALPLSSHHRSTAEHGASVLKKAVEEHAAAPLDQPHVLRRVPLIIVQMIG